MSVLFLHGAGGFVEDRPLLEQLRADLGVEVRMTELDDADLSFTRWSAQIAAALRPDTELVIGHSHGGAIALKMLTEARLPVRRLVLLAAPEWGPRGWDVAEYALSDAAPLPTDTLLELRHCADDDIVRPPTWSCCPPVSRGRPPHCGPTADTSSPGATSSGGPREPEDT